MSIYFDSRESQTVFSLLQERAQLHKLCGVKYLLLGVSTIRVLCYTDKVLPIMEHQLGYVLQDSVDQYDYTIIVWMDEDISGLWKNIARNVTPKTGMQIRSLRMLPQFQCPIESKEHDNKYLGILDGEMLEFFDSDAKTVYVSYKSFEPEEYVKYGHAFVRVINRLVQTETVNLTHGAAFGYNGNGVLLCGRGKRGKSTLTVESMLQGFDYISDDYQIIEKTNNGLLAYPIYSMITLSYRMYNEMFDRFHGKFLCNNFTQDKYLFNIDVYHSQFRSAYPIRFCLFPEIVADAHPSIVTCNTQEKGRAIVQLIHSTLLQMGQLQDTRTIRKLLDMLRDMPFLKINLSNNIAENSAFLKDYLTKMSFSNLPVVETESILMDITFGLSVILDTRTCLITTLNKFATNILMLLLSGVPKETVIEMIEPLKQHNPEIMAEFESLLRLIEERSYYSLSLDQYPEVSFLPEFAVKSGYKMSVMEYRESNVKELL